MLSPNQSALPLSTLKVDSKISYSKANPSYLREMIATSDLTFRYKNSNSTLSFPDIKCEQGGKLLILGDSGSGKTTLLHLLCGLLNPVSGTVNLKGVDITSLNERDLDSFRGSNVGVVFQKAHFVESLTVSENLALPAMLTSEDISSAELQNRTHELLERLGLGHKAHSLPKDLSIGEQQRASIARAIIHKPQVVFADEPTSALDDRSTEAVVSLLEEESKRAGASLIIVTHDQRLKSRYSDRVELKDIAL